MGISTLKVVNNDFVFENERLTQITELDALTQIIRNRLKMWLGEWFANEEAGIDYFGLFNQDKKLSIEKRARLIFKKAILADTRILKIKKMDITFNNRSLTINFWALAKDGEVTASVTV